MHKWSVQTRDGRPRPRKENNRRAHFRCSPHWEEFKLATPSAGHSCASRLDSVPNPSQRQRHRSKHRETPSTTPSHLPSQHPQHPTYHTQRTQNTNTTLHHTHTPPITHHRTQCTNTTQPPLLPPNTSIKGMVGAMLEDPHTFSRPLESVKNPVRRGASLSATQQVVNTAMKEPEWKKSSSELDMIIPDLASFQVVTCNYH